MQKQGNRHAKRLSSASDILYFPLSFTEFCLGKKA